MDAMGVCVDHKYLEHLQYLEEMDFIARTSEHLFHPRPRGVRLMDGYKALDAYIEDVFTRLGVRFLKNVHILTLYRWNKNSEGPSPENIVADLLEEFLIGLALIIKFT